MPQSRPIPSTPSGGVVMVNELEEGGAGGTVSLLGTADSSSPLLVSSPAMAVLAPAIAAADGGVRFPASSPAHTPTMAATSTQNTCAVDLMAPQDPPLNPNSTSYAPFAASKNPKETNGAVGHENETTPPEGVDGIEA